MKCPNCGHGEHRALRADHKEGGLIRRRRECLACGFRWFTIEAIETIYERANDVIEAAKQFIGVVGKGE